MTAMIKLRHQQPSLWHRGLAEDIEGLWEPWMRLVDELLEDEQLLDTVYEAQGERHPQSRSRGRMQTPAEVLLRATILPPAFAFGHGCGSADDVLLGLRIPCPE